MPRPRNILFIMCDQLRFDYLSCHGHPTLQTPHIDALAERGVSFTRAFCQSPICGPSRMSFYTGRYMSSHGANWNGFPLSVHEWTLGDYLRPLDYRVALIGKTHHAADTEGMARLGISPHSQTGIYLSQCGFEPYERDDGLHPDQSVDPDLAYNRYLNEQGYPGKNPWHDVANSAATEHGEILSGWQMRHARLPARVAEQHSETAYMTDRAIQFIEEASDQPWCAHLSYIKPHWPYIAPEPYHAIYSAQDILPAQRTEQERTHPHPVVAAFMQHEDSQSFHSQEVRETVIPTYMGLIKQIDDHIGRLVAYLKRTERLQNTLIVFTSDHGDYLGDHWLGEKDLLHDTVAQIPLIICDPDKRADVTRGQQLDHLVESIDLIPTFIEAAEGEYTHQRLEGRSLLPLLHNLDSNNVKTVWRDAVFSEADYAMRQARLTLGLTPSEARAYMIRTQQWKYIHYEHYPPQLFNIQDDPQELHDLGTDAGHESIRKELHEHLFDWLRHRRTRVTVSDQRIEKTTNTSRQRGFFIGVW